MSTPPPDRPVLSDDDLLEMDNAVRVIRDAGRVIWGGHAPMTLPEITVCLQVIVGDIAREARNDIEFKPVNHNKVGVEFANLVLSTFRWMYDLGMNPMVYMRQAVDAQERYAS